MRQDIKSILGIKKDESSSFINGGLAIMWEFKISYEDMVNLPLPTYFILQDKLKEIYKARSK